MKRKLALVVSALFAFMFITGCSNSNNEINLNDVVNKLIESGLYSESLTESDSTMIGGMLCLYDDSVIIADEDITEGYYYTTIGENADQIIAVKCPDEKASQKVFQAMGLYLNGTKDSMEFYNPDEVAKLDGAVVLQKGKYAILTVAEDADALSELVSKLFA